MTGGGKGAEAFKKVIRDKLGGAVNDPVTTIRKRMNETSKAMLNWQICAEMKKFTTGAESYFAKDICRGLDITLSDGTNTFKLTNNFDTARDELARFITGDGTATYNSIPQTERNKVNVLTSLLSQEFEKAAEDGAGYALDKREAEQAFTLGRDRTRPASRKFTVEKSKSGDISVEYSMNRPIKSVATDDFEDGIDVGPDSAFKAGIRYTLSRNEFDRVANHVDYSKFDDSEALRLFNSPQTMPDGTKQFAEQKSIKAVNTFAEEFRIKAGCQTGFDIVLNPSDSDLVEARR